MLGLLVVFRVKSSETELADCFDALGKKMSDYPSGSAFCQQRAKLFPEAMRTLFLTFTAKLTDWLAPNRCTRRKGGVCWQLLAVDGTNVSFQNCRDPEADDWRTTHKTGKEHCAAHVTALWDAAEKLYLDAVIQPLHRCDERAAPVEMISRYKPPRGVKPILLADRGFPSWNVLAHLKVKRFHFIIRCKDKDVRSSMLWPLKLPDEETFDIWVKLRSAEKRIIRLHSGAALSVSFW